MESKSAAPPSPPPRRRLSHFAGMYRYGEALPPVAPNRNAATAPDADPRGAAEGDAATSDGSGSGAQQPPPLDADVQFAATPRAAADADGSAETPAAAANGDAEGGGPSIVSGWDSVGSEFFRAITRARTTGAAATPAPTRSGDGSGKENGSGNSEGDRDESGSGEDRDPRANAKAKANQSPESESDSGSRRGSRSRSRSHSRSSDSSRSRSRSRSRGGSRSPTRRIGSDRIARAHAAPTRRTSAGDADAAVAMSALEFVRSAVEVVRSTIGNHQSETTGAGASDASSSDSEGAESSECDRSVDPCDNVGSGESEGEEDESDAEAGEEDDAAEAEAQAEGEGESDEESDAKGASDGSGDDAEAEDADSAGERDNAADGSGTRTSDVPKVNAVERNDFDGAEPLDRSAARSAANAQRKSEKSKPRARGAKPFQAVVSALIVALVLVLAGVAVHRARLRAGHAYGFQRWSGGPVFSAFPRSLSEAVARWQDGVTTPLGLTAAYIPGCVVQMKRCHEGAAYGLAGKRAASGFLERQTLLGVVTNSTATATPETCAGAARVWHQRCGNFANERVYTRFVDRNSTHTLCVYPPRGVQFELPKYLDAAGVCASPTECERIAECFERRGWGGERWTRERMSNAELSACLPAYGQRLSWFTATSAGAFQHPTEWRQRIDCERLPSYTLAREAEVARRIAGDSASATAAFASDA